MSSPGVGLIGLGRHGKRYAQHLSKHVTAGRLVGMCRRDEASGAALAAEYGVRFYRDYHELIADPAVDAVVVVTPPSAALPICLEAIRAGKPILIEKPLAVTSENARQMVEAARAAGIPLMTAQTLRFEPAITELKALVTALGPQGYLALSSRVEPRPENHRDPSAFGERGVLLEVGIHLLDLVRFLTEEEVVEVHCQADEEAGGKPESRASATLTTFSGKTCLIDVARVSPGRVGRCEWIGAETQVLADWVRHRMCRWSFGGRAEEWDVPERATVVATLEAFLGALAKGGPMPITGLDGQRAVEIADACYRSIAQGGRKVAVKSIEFG